MRIWGWIKENWKWIIVLGYFLFFFIFCLAMSIHQTAKAREPMNLKFVVGIEYRASVTQSWYELERVEFDGIGALQFSLASGNQYRMILQVAKPHDLAGTFKVRMVTRTDGIVLPEGQDYGKIILGPHEGCVQNAQNRCSPLSLNDVGLVELQLNLKKAEKTSLGFFHLRPYDNLPPVTIRPFLEYQDKELPCGSYVEKGWWIFAKKIEASGSEIDTISLCVSKPDGKVKCADDLEYEIKVRTDEVGTYKFSVWNKQALARSCEIFVTK